ncbi:MAG: hypothetical protein KatS3mg051_2197 [Anaerolineae bacterium]|nr:MAG: hypothetical protein KatS3mg051_2197 [Anaerolineae bacterium]
MGDTMKNSTMPHVTILRVTPDMAKEWLKNNDHNRTIAKKRVDLYASLMHAGRWYLSSDAIVLDTDGRLLNGQHRLLAVIQSGVASDFIVGFGWDPEAFYVLDDGKKRSGADALHIEGHVSTKTLAAAAKLIHLFEQGALNSGLTNSLPNAEIIKTVRRHPSLPESVRFASRYTDQAIASAPPSIFAFLHYVYGREYQGEIEAFVQRCTTGVGIRSKSDPAFLFNKRMQVNTFSKAKLPRNVILALAIKAANAAVQGKQMTVLKWSPGQGEAFPSPCTDPSDPRFDFKR